jgi:cytochrome d ubiquinol oxidase subunit I
LAADTIQRVTISSDPVLWHRLQFAFTATYHYLFPQLTMGLAPLIVLWKLCAIRSGNARYAEAARFWTRIFGLTFAVGVVTGIPLEFQFGTDWAGFSRYAGGVVGQTLAMEGMFAFFLESALVGTLVFGEARLSRRAHFAVSVGVCTGSWLSAYFILATNAFMQHPVGFAIAPDGSLQLANLGGYLMNSWAWSMLAHNQAAALVSGAFVVAGTGAYYQLRGVHQWQGDFTWSSQQCGRTLLMVSASRGFV